MRELLGALDDAKRVVVILVELEGMTSAEVATGQGVPPGTRGWRQTPARPRHPNLIAPPLAVGRLEMRGQRKGEEDGDEQPAVMDRDGYAGDAADLHLCIHEWTPQD